MLAETTIVVMGLCMGLVGGYGMQLHRSRKWERRWLTGAEVAAERSRRTLTQCCELGSHAMMVDMASGNTSPARFLAATSEAVQFETTGAGGDQECWSRRSLVAVQFNLEGKARMFVAPLIEATPGTSGATYLTAALPRYIADGDARAAFRIDMGADEEVLATVRHENGEFKAILTDASTTGMGLRGDILDLDELKRGDVVEIQVSLAGELVTRAGVLKRIQGSSLGVAFPIVSGDNAPPEQEAYFELIRSLLDREKKT